MEYTGHCQIKVKVTVCLQIFLHLPQYKLSSPISQLSSEISSGNANGDGVNSLFGDLAVVGLD